MSIKLTDRTRELALEFFSIVLGVLLALGLSEWAEDHEHQKLADAAMVNIANELVANRELLQLIHENNVTTIQLINAYEGASKQT